MKADKAILEVVVKVYADAICDVLNIATNERFRFTPVDIEDLEVVEGSYACIIAPKKVLDEIAERGEVDAEEDKKKVLILVGDIKGGEVILQIGIHNSEKNEMTKILKKAKKVIEELTICRLIRTFGDAVATQIIKILSFGKN